ncbi:protein TIC 20-I, chloroplastic-like [Cornus florida]|uniref:protein TIC 20-I, chloroplastic-like n=1 Tax=Cornus florida TaxID=4283 RepID=UPI00289E033D|nr:protein TIC 20-I, chloroplastic-like [Cornus florida]
MFGRCSLSLSKIPLDPEIERTLRHLKKDFGGLEKEMMADDGENNRAVARVVIAAKTNGRLYVVLVFLILCSLSLYICVCVCVCVCVSLCRTSTLHISAASTPFLTGDQGGLSDRIPMLTRRQRFFISPRASKNVPYSFQDPVKKPRWWWRTLACLSYFKPLREPWTFAKTAYHLHPFSEEKCLTYPFRLAHGRLPWWWFGMAYIFIVYLGAVKKEWPHFYMFHNMMAMLLPIPLQMMLIVSIWMPLTVYLGKVGMHFWTAFTFVYLFTVLVCMRCALAGKHADAPFFCDAAYILSLYRRGK